MSMICPLCNGLRNLQAHICPECGDDMQDKGRVSMFFGPYSPYEELRMTNSSDEKCVHLFSCSKCGKNFRMEIGLIEM